MASWSRGVSKPATVTRLETTGVPEIEAKNVPLPPAPLTSAS